jgi:hypothetical protein
MVLAAALCAGCYKVTYTNPQLPRSGQTAVTKGHFLIFGLVGHKDIPVYEMCPSGASMIRSKETFVDVLLTAITIGIYAPRTYVVHCGGGAS